MTTNTTIVTSKEIAKFRDELVDYPKAEIAAKAIAALDVIEEECDGYLEDAIPLLLMRETGQEAEKGLGDLLEQSRQFICQKDVREALESGLIAPAIEPVSMSVGIPPGTATAIAILAFKLGMKRLCADCDD